MRPEKPGFGDATRVPSGYDFGFVLESFRLAAWFAMATHCESPNECIMMSVTGARVLGDMGMKARVLPCELWGSTSRGARFACGARPEKVRSIMAQQGAATTDLDVLNPDGVHMHAVIHAEWKGQSAVIDLTVCQLWPIVGDAVPASWVIPGKPWHRVDTDECAAQYTGSSISVEDARKLAGSGFSKSIYDDIVVLLPLAMGCGNDPGAMTSTMWQANADIMRIIHARAQSWVAHG